MVNVRSAFRAERVVRQGAVLSVALSVAAVYLVQHANHDSDGRDPQRHKAERLAAQSEATRRVCTLRDLLETACVVKNTGTSAVKVEDDTTDQDLAIDKINHSSGSAECCKCLTRSATLAQKVTTAVSTGKELAQSKEVVQYIVDKMVPLAVRCNACILRDRSTNSNSLPSIPEDCDIQAIVDACEMLVPLATLASISNDHDSNDDAHNKDADVSIPHTLTLALLWGALASRARIDNLLVADESQKPEAASGAIGISGVSTQIIRDELDRCEQFVRLMDTTPVSIDTLVRKTVSNILDPALNHGQWYITSRRRQQLLMVLYISRRGKWQVPFMLASSLLSMLVGTAQSARVYFHSELLDMAGKRVMDAVQTGTKAESKKRRTSLLTTVSALLVIEALVVVAEIVKDRVNDVGRVNFIRELKTALFQSLLSKDLSVLESSDLMNTRHSIGNAGYVLSQLFDLPVTALGAAARIFTSLALLWRQSPQLSIAMAVLLPARLGMDSLLLRAREKFELCFSAAPPADIAGNRDVWAMLINPVAIRTMRLFAREPTEVARFNRLLRQQDRANTKDKIAHTLFYPLDELLSRLVTVGGLWYGSSLVHGGRMRAADVGAFVTLAGMTFEQVQFMWHFVQQTGNQVLDPVEEMYQLLHGSEPSIGLSEPPMSSMPADPSKVVWDLSMSNVYFKYPSRPGVSVLQGVSLHVNEGERVGLLGSSGCGKSTVLSLLARLYEVDSGRVRVAGKDVKEWNPLWLRRHVVVVAQTQFFPCRTVHDNLALALQARYNLNDCDDGEHNQASSSSSSFTDNRNNNNNNNNNEASSMVSDDVISDSSSSLSAESSWTKQMDDALRLTRCHAIFFDRTRFPGGWHTDLGKDASKLSGGEKQRLALAMAILRRPRVLCLDEATSALDEESQYQVQEALEEVYVQRRDSGDPMTVLTIAHRLSNFRHVDRLVVMEAGRVVEEGPPKELLRNENGLFSLFLKRQTDTTANFGVE